MSRCWAELFFSWSVCHFQDDPPAMDFVTAAANLRMHIFSMNMKSRFDVKCECWVKVCVCVSVCVFV